MGIEQEVSMVGKYKSELDRTTLLELYWKTEGSDQSKVGLKDL